MNNEFADAVFASECTQSVIFDQAEVLANSPHAKSILAEGDKGPICWGLSFVWLKYKANGSHEKFFEHTNAEDDGTTSFAAGLYRYVQGKSDQFKVAAEYCGLKRDMDEHGGHTSESLSSREPSKMRELADFLSEARGNHFFIIGTSKHAMAASSSRTGRLMFFDPNFGVAETNSTANMAKFFLIFFNYELITRKYFGGTTGPNVDIHSFKKA